MNYSLPAETPKGQRDAINADNADSEIITVEAGAGTGKTWVLSERYLRLLLEDNELLPSDILTLTYTDAAAGEMKARIEARLTQALNDFKDAERKQKILDGLSDSWISTIHSFATRLIRESGLSLDIDPRASVITDHQEQEFWEDIRKAAEFSELGRLAGNYGGVLLKHAKSLDNDERMTYAVGKWGASALSIFARETAELHASSGRSWEEMLEWAKNDSELIERSSGLVKDILKSEWLKVWNTFFNMQLPKAKNPEGTGAILNDLMSWQQSASPENEKELKHFYKRILIDNDIKANKGEPFATLGQYLGMTLGDWRKTQSPAVRNVTENFDAALADEEKEMRKTLMKFCAVSWGMWDTMKSKRKVLSFSDMILHARKAVEQNGIRRTFKYILVDEFQDTDPLQFKMIEALNKYGGKSKLFAVGDPKQSIYRFRHADPSLFAEISRRDGTQNIHLDESFRTRESLLTKINMIFSSLWLNGISRLESMRDVKYNPLKAANSDDERNSGTMPDFRIILAQSQSDSKIQDTKKALAEKLAEKINSWVTEGCTVWDKKGKTIRPVKFSDFAILSRGRGCFDILEEALEKFNIPSVQDRSSDYFSRGEIGDVVCTLRAAADMNDDFSVTGWLMSPFSGTSEDDAVTKCLTLIDDNHRPVDLIRDNLHDTYSYLERLSIVGENEGAAGILSIIDSNRKWLSCYKPNDRLRVLRNVRLALNIAREFQSSGTSSLVSCAEYLTRSVRNQSSYEEPAWHDDGENAVRLGAVHSAKGLEYPVTVIFEDRKGARSDSTSLNASRELGIVMKSLPDECGAKNTKLKFSDWDKLLSEQGDSEEEERLFYVACTRAQDSLIFCGILTSKSEAPKSTWTKLMLDNTQNMNDIDDIKEYVNINDGAKIISSSVKVENKSFTAVKIVNPEISLRQISATSFALYEFCPYAWRRKYRQGLKLEWEHVDRENNDDVIGGSELGSLAHWILTRWPSVNDEDYMSKLDYYLHNKEVITLLPGYLRDMWRKNDKDNKSSLKEWLMNFADSELGVKLRSKNNIEREYRFREWLNGKTIMSGAVDVVDGSDIIDYKITEINRVPPGLYESQMDFYAYIIHMKKNLDSVNACIALLRENKTLNRTVSNFDDIRERIIRASEICASGPYNPNLNHCSKCPFKKGCVKNAG